MRIGVPKETAEGERRVALVPDVVKSLRQSELDVTVESGAGAEHQHLGGRHGAGGGGHHRKEAPGLARRQQRRGVAGDVGLRAERVHRLRPGNARDRLHREAGHARLREGLGRLR